MDVPSMIRYMLVNPPELWPRLNHEQWKQYRRIVDPYMKHWTVEQWSHFHTDPHWQDERIQKWMTKLAYDIETTNERIKRCFP